MAVRPEDLQGLPPLDIEEPGAPRPEQEVIAGGPYKVSKAVAAYRQDDLQGKYQCVDCAAFVEPKICLILKSRVAASGHCDLWMPGPAATDEPTDHPVNRDQVNYVSHDDGVSCQLCSKFSSPNECAVVIGEVDPMGFCRLFERLQSYPRRGLGAAVTSLGVSELYNPEPG